MSISLMGVMLGLPCAGKCVELWERRNLNNGLNQRTTCCIQRLTPWEEMRRDGQASGYDVTEMVWLFKTHLTQNKSSYFVWKDIDGKNCSKNVGI